MLESYYATERREQKRFGEFIRTTITLLNTVGEFDLLLRRTALPYRKASEQVYLSLDPRIGVMPGSHSSILTSRCLGTCLPNAVSL